MEHYHYSILLLDWFLLLLNCFWIKSTWAQYVISLNVHGLSKCINFEEGVWSRCYLLSCHEIQPTVLMCHPPPFIDASIMTPPITIEWELWDVQMTVALKFLTMTVIQKVLLWLKAMSDSWNTSASSVLSDVDVDNCIILTSRALTWIFTNNTLPDIVKTFYWFCIQLIQLPCISSLLSMFK